MNNNEYKVPVYDLSGKVAIVTGATKGLGYGVAMKLAAAGAKVVITSRHQDECDAVAQEIKELGGEACGIKTDVQVVSEIQNLVDQTVEKYGRLDIMVNNAGVAPENRADLLDMEESSFDRVMGINLKGPFFLTQAVAKRMVANKDGAFKCIINTGSVSADYASINRGEYCLFKAGIAMATKLFSVRLADEGICVYEIRPGVIKSDMTSVVSAKYDKMIAEGLTLQRRWGMPEDIGKAVVMLVDGALAYSTGQVINVDGGLTIERF
jgi:NAD(P)-dependent dehydrogenase (short-subunit alcohol dehydrogenase family)